LNAGINQRKFARQFYAFCSISAIILIIVVLITALKRLKGVLLDQVLISSGYSGSRFRVILLKNLPILLEKQEGF